MYRRIVAVILLLGLTAITSTTASVANDKKLAEFDDKLESPPARVDIPVPARVPATVIVGTQTSGHYFLRVMTTWPGGFISEGDSLHNYDADLPARHIDFAGGPQDYQIIMGRPAWRSRNDKNETPHGLSFYGRGHWYIAGLDLYWLQAKVVPDSSTGEVIVDYLIVVGDLSATSTSVLIAQLPPGVRHLFER